MGIDEMITRVSIQERLTDEQAKAVAAKLRTAEEKEDIAKLLIKDLRRYIRGEIKGGGARDILAMHAYDYERAGGEDE